MDIKPYTGRYVCDARPLEEHDPLLLDIIRDRVEEFSKRYTSIEFSRVMVRDFTYLAFIGGDYPLFKASYLRYHLRTFFFSEGMCTSPTAAWMDVIDQYQRLVNRISDPSFHAIVTI